MISINEILVWRILIYSINVYVNHVEWLFNWDQFLIAITQFMLKH